MGTDEGGAEPGMQFDEVEHAAPEAARACAKCTRQITDEYFEVGGSVLCPACGAELRGGQGGAGPFLRAVAYGGGAAVLSTLVWYLIVKLTGYELGLIAVAVGLFIGFAVRRGSRARGGWKYQALAIALTYGSITASTIPFIIDAIRSESKKRASAEVAATDGKVDDKTGGKVDDKTDGKPEPAPAPASDRPDKPLTAGDAAIGIAFLLGLALASPFLQGFDNILGILIIGFALYEAWKVNRRVPVNGPFRLGPAPTT
jgi:hypothetical protein